MKDAFDLAEGRPPHASYPPFGARYLRAIELAVRCAWKKLLADPVKAAELATSNEVDISHQLRTALNDLREHPTGEVNEYNCDAFERPHLGAEFQTSEGKIRKPDLVFFLAGPPRPGVIDGMRDGIFVECKILDEKKTVSDYCNKGLQRFVDGDYAAWMREGMMLAYVRNKHALPGSLAKLGTQETFRKSLAWDGSLPLCGLTEVTPSIYVTVHQRQWEYDDPAGTPGPIKVRHLWLQTVEG
jgi:hypothetical protein